MGSPNEPSISTDSEVIEGRRGHGRVLPLPSGGSTATGSGQYGADPVFADGAVQRQNRGTTRPSVPRLFRPSHCGEVIAQSTRGDIALPIVRIETSQKAQRGVHLVDLAAYIDKRRAAAVKECRQLTGTM